MWGKIIGTAFAAALAASSAGAVTVDFVTEANGNERGEADGYILQNANTGNIRIKFDAFGNHPYFDSGTAGLGVCKVLTVPGAQCDPPGDDNVTITEKIKLTFLEDSPSDKTLLQKVSGFVFRKANHALYTVASTDTLLFGYNGGVLVQYTFGALMAKTFDGIYSMTFKYDDGENSANQFYLSSYTSEAPSGGVLTPVPLPATAPLMLAGLGLLGLGLRRRSKRSA